MCSAQQCTLCSSREKWAELAACGGNNEKIQKSSRRRQGTGEMIMRKWILEGFGEKGGSFNFGEWEEKIRVSRLDIYVKSIEGESLVSEIKKNPSCGEIYFLHSCQGPASKNDPFFPIFFPNFSSKM